MSHQEIEQLQQAITALEGQRAMLSDAVIDAALLPLRSKLEELQARQLPGTGQAFPYSRGTSPERKLITVLFADISGFTARSESLDPEDVNKLINTLWRYLDAIILEHGGHIDKHMGDGIMALWGAGEAREDDPEQAIRAALAMQQKIASLSGAALQDAGERPAPDRFDVEDVAGNLFDLSLEIRVGIHTGPVVLGQVGTTLEFTAMGDTVNLASRLQDAAPLGGVLISHDTYRHVIGVFDVQVLEPVRVKGKRDAVQIYLVRRAKPRAFRLQPRGVEGVETRMVGRMREMQHLQATFLGTLQVGQLQAITLVGEAGIGKSRLLYEFDLWAELLPQQYYYFQGRARQGMQGHPFALLRDLFATRFALQDNDPQPLIWQKFAQGIAEGMPRLSAHEMEMRAHFIGQFLGYDFRSSPHLQSVLGGGGREPDPSQLHSRALLYLQDYFKALTAQAMVMILLEDLHWADDSSLDALEILMRRLQEQPILVIATGRRSLYERRSEWGERLSFHTRLDLHPLNQRDSWRLVDEILQKADSIPAALREMIVGNADGNPFYMEELIKMLVDDGVILVGDENWQIDSQRLETVRVPTTLAAVLQARFDRLPAPEREALQHAAVIGRIFWDQALAYVGGASDGAALVGGGGLSGVLRSLCRREIILERELSTFAGSREYTFKHALLREATYESVLKRQRRVCHARTAEWLLQRADERAVELAGLIAEHLELAGDVQAAASYLRQAGERAAIQFANIEALRYLTHALELASAGDLQTLCALLLAREKVYDLTGQRQPQQQDLDALEALLPSLDICSQAEIALRRANYANFIDDYPAAVVAAQKAIALGEECGQQRYMAAGHLQWGRTLRWLGDYPAARQHFEQVLVLARQAETPILEAESLVHLGVIGWYQGEHSQSWDYYSEALKIYQELGERRGEIRALNSLGIHAKNVGNYNQARRCYEQALDACRATGYRLGEGMTLNNLGGIDFMLGGYAQARLYYEQALPIFREIGDRQGEGLVLDNLGSIHFYLQEYPQSLNYHQQSLAITRQIGDPASEGYTLTNIGFTLSALGQAQQALEAFQSAIQIRCELGQPHLAAESRSGLADLYLKRGDLQPAQAQVEEILAYLEGGGSLSSIENPVAVHWICYQVLLAAQDGRAGKVLETAYQLLQEMAAAASDPEARRALLQNIPHNRKVLEEWGKN